MRNSRDTLAGFAHSQFPVPRSRLLTALAFFQGTATSIAVAAALLAAGCTGGKSEYRELSDESELKQMAAEEHEHHHTEGPHGGHILELGEYDGEITLGDNRQVTVYILGQDAQAPYPLKDAQVVLKLDVDGKPVEVALKSDPLEGETASSSRFVSPPGSIPETITDIEHVHGTVMVTVDGKELIGEIAHEHEHHDHAH